MTLVHTDAPSASSAPDLSDFSRWLVAGGASGRTRQQYLTNLRRVFRLGLDPLHVTDAELFALGLSPSVVSTVRTSLNKLRDYLAEGGALPEGVQPTARSKLERLMPFVRWLRSPAYVNGPSSAATAAHYASVLSGLFSRLAKNPGYAISTATSADGNYHAAWNAFQRFASAQPEAALAIGLPLQVEQFLRDTQATEADSSLRWALRLLVTRKKWSPEALARLTWGDLIYERGSGGELRSVEAWNILHSDPAKRRLYRLIGALHGHNEADMLVLSVLHARALPLTGDDPLVAAAPNSSQHMALSQIRRLVGEGSTSHAEDIAGTEAAFGCDDVTAGDTGDTGDEE